MASFGQLQLPLGIPSNSSTSCAMSAAKVFLQNKPNLQMAPYNDKSTRTARHNAPPAPASSSLESRSELLQNKPNLLTH
jgi:hypothetical protein